MPVDSERSGACRFGPCGPRSGDASAAHPGDLSRPHRRHHHTLGDCSTKWRRTQRRPSADRRCARGFGRVSEQVSYETLAAVSGMSFVALAEMSPARWPSGWCPGAWPGGTAWSRSP